MIKNLEMDFDAFIEEQMKALFEEQKERKFILHTGAAGMNAFNHALEIRNLVDHAEWFLEKKKITEVQCESLKNMLESEDIENFYLAKEILIAKQKEYDARI